MAIKNWKDEPKLEDYVTGEEATAEEYAAYLADLEFYAAGPQRKDYKSDADFEKDFKIFQQTDTFFGDRIPGAPAGSTARMPDRRETLVQRYRKAVEEYEKKFTPEERTAAVVAKQQKEKAKTTEQRTRAIDETVKATTGSILFTDSIGARSAYGGTSRPGQTPTPGVGYGGISRPGDPNRPTEDRIAQTSKLTYAQWQAIYAAKSSADSPDYDPDFMQRFRTIAGQILDINPQLIDDVSLTNVWLNIGRYAIERSQETGKPVDPLDMTNLQDIKDWNKTQDEKDPQYQAAKQAAISNLQEFYFQNGLEFTEQQMTNTVDRIMKGELTLDGYQNSVRSGILAKMFPDWADSIKGGLNIRDLADSYIGKMASVLELDAETIDLRDDLIQKAIQSKTPDGKMTTQSLRDFEITLRNDKRWEKTSNARQEITNMGQFILEKFGMR
jgi:hypothetical protein